MIINPSNDVLSLRERCIESFGAFWYYVIKSDGTLLLPVNNMYFRSGGASTAVADVGSYLKPSLPKVNDLKNIVQKTTSGTKLHNGDWKYIVTSGTVHHSYANADSWSYDSTSGLVAPPSVQTYTYIVCF